MYIGARLLSLCFEGVDTQVLRNVGETVHHIAMPSPNKRNYCVGFEVFRAVVMEIIIFWDMTPCSPFSVNRRFGGTYGVHL
jgi:hypothetical protein